MEAVRSNIRDNLHHARFVFLIGDSKKYLDILKSIVPLSEINMEVYYAAGGVQYRHLFSAATRYSGPFAVHNSDIAVGDMSVVIDACHNFDDAALVVSRYEVYEGEPSDEKQTCTYMMNLGSFDEFITNSKSFDCKLLNSLQFKHCFFGAENVMAALLPKTTIANLCPRWRSTHYHDTAVAVRPPRRVRINHGKTTGGRKTDLKMRVNCLGFVILKNCL